MVRISLLCFSLVVGNVLARPALEMRSDSEHQQPQGLQMREESAHSAPLGSELLRRVGTPPPTSPPSSPVSSTGSHKGDNSDNEEEQEEYLREDWVVSEADAAALTKEMDTVTVAQLTRRAIDTYKAEVVQYLERRLGPFPSLLTIAKFFHKKTDAKKLLFWSKVTLSTAKKFGVKKDLHLLSDLMKEGQFEQWTKQKIAWTQKAPWWERHSAGMAVKAAIDKGEVWVMIPRSGMMVSTSVWNRIERPHLQKRGIKINWVDEKGLPIPEAEIKWPGKA